MTRLLFRDADTLYDLMRADGRLNVPDSEASFGIPIVAPPRAPCDPPHSGDFRAAYLASLVGVRPNSCLRDVRDKP